MVRAHHPSTWVQPEKGGLLCVWVGLYPGRGSVSRLGCVLGGAVCLGVACLGVALYPGWGSVSWAGLCVLGVAVYWAGLCVYLGRDSKRYWNHSQGASDPGLKQWDRM